MPGDNKRGVNKVIFYGLTQEVYPTLKDIFSVVRYMLSTKESLHIIANIIVISTDLQCSVNKYRYKIGQFKQTNLLSQKVLYFTFKWGIIHRPKENSTKVTLLLEPRFGLSIFC